MYKNERLMLRNMQFVDDYHTDQIFGSQIDRKIFLNLCISVLNNTKIPYAFDILCFKFGIMGYPKLKHREIGQLYGLSTPRVNQIVYSSLKKLRKYFEKEK